MKCFVNLRYKQHKTDYETIPETRPILVPCHVSGCKCKSYHYVPKNGTQPIRCQCKHFADEHSEVVPYKCSKGCACKKFISSYTCGCGQPTYAHKVSVLWCLTTINLLFIYFIIFGGQGDVVISALDSGSSWIWALVGIIVLCSWAMHFTLKGFLSTYNHGRVVLEISPAPCSMLEIPTQSMHTNFYPNIEKGGGGNFFQHLRPRL